MTGQSVRERRCQQCGSLLSTRKFLARVCWDEGETRKREICLTNNQSHYGCFLNNLPRALILNASKEKKRSSKCFGRVSNSQYFKLYGPCKNYLTGPLWHKSRLCATVDVYFKCGSSFLPCQPLLSDLIWALKSPFNPLIHSFIQPMIVWRLGDATFWGCILENIWPWEVH